MKACINCLIWMKNTVYELFKQKLAWFVYYEEQNFEPSGMNTGIKFPTQQNTRQPCKLAGT